MRPHDRTPRGGSARAFTIVELLVVVSIVALLVAILAPAVSRGRDKALITQSVSNLRSLATSNEAYAGDWGDRQFTACPDDAGLGYGNCTVYLQQIACPPQQLIGRDTYGVWGYFLGSSGKCAALGWPEACFNWQVYEPIHFGSSFNQGGGSGFGSFRIPGVMKFADYINGRFYDPALYAPKDVVALEEIGDYLAGPAGFTFDGERYADSSYCWSPAAMFDARVFARNSELADGNGFTHPSQLPASYRSPPVSRCRHPSLKTRMIEHAWLQNRPEQLVNPNFAGSEPWYFNHGLHSSPSSLFFDGHVELVGCARAMRDESRVGSLWSRNTPFGTAGYYGNQSYDFLVHTSFHVLTTDGIEGRDIIGTEG